jgi:uncharacterized membrane protein
MNVDWYPWLVVAHIIGAFLFAMAHGVSAFVMFQVRKERDRARIASLLELSGASIGLMFAGLLVVLVAGIAAGIMGNWFGRGWIWLSLVLLIVVGALMTPLASGWMNRLRVAVGAPTQASRKGEPLPPPATDEELAALLDTRRPELVAAMGAGGLIVILLLMTLKPF